MRAVIVYESMFGNTQTIARRIADGLKAGMTVDLVEVGSATPETASGADLLVVGGPTHAFGMTRPNTRADAATKTHQTLVSSRNGIREWLESLPPGQGRAATFDTRVDHPRVPGSAAKGAAKRLRKHGLTVDAAESFFVHGMNGPLVDGEDDRARAWGRDLAGSSVPQRARPSAALWPPKSSSGGAVWPPPAGHSG